MPDSGSRRGGSAMIKEGSCGTSRIEMALCQGHGPAFSVVDEPRSDEMQDTQGGPGADSESSVLYPGIHVRASHSSPYRSGSCILPSPQGSMQDSSSVLRMSPSQLNVH